MKMPKMGGVSYDKEQEKFMRIRINVNSLKNAMGTVFLLAAAFFVCSTFLSVRSVFADPIVNTESVVRTNIRQSPRNQTTSRANVSRTTVSRATSAQPRATASRTTQSRANATRNVSSRSITPTRATNVSSRNVVSRSGAQNRTTSNRAVRARSGAATRSRVGTSGSVMAANRASAYSTNVTYLASKLYTGSYSNIIDSSTGLISADAYSNCMESYYTCMDEICTARSSTKGRCSCAGRATNFLEAEEQLEAANEELIKLSGQLSLLIATKGKGKDLSAAFSLTEAEQVMNCVSYKEADDKEEWCKDHPTYKSNGDKEECKMPSYCTSNNYGFDIADIDGSSSDILAQLKAWAETKDLAKQYSTEDSDKMVYRATILKTAVTSAVSKVIDDEEESASLDSLANKWGYKLFEYAHNNVCGRVLDSCFNGIYEACGTPVSVTDSDSKTHNKCANGATSSCPFNYNSYISVNGTTGDVVLNERSTSNTSSASSASCFGYTTTTTNVTRSVSTVSSDPYYTLRGPVADARRSIMQKYLLDANSSCDVYGEALQTTAQNIKYQKIAAEQALKSKRLEFKQEADAKALADAEAAIDNYSECLGEIIDCYEEYADEEKWTTARIKAYCSQVAQVPHCYETMICAPQRSQLMAVIDLPDSTTTCKYSNDYTKNMCRNVVTISEILYGTGASDADVNNISEIVPQDDRNYNSAALREKCLRGEDGTTLDFIRGWKKPSNTLTE